MVSIIVPAYNVEDYIESCISSITNSTFRDFELILVDDGSTDNTPTLCDKFASIDGRVHVIHQPNSGVASARNAGLKVAQGDFITFVDSDDLVHPQMLEVLWNAISGGDYDMAVVWLCRVTFGQGTHYLNCPLEELGDSEFKSLTQQDYVASMFTDSSGSYSGPCHKLYKRGLIFQPDGSFLEFKPIYAEDVEWLTRVILRLDNYIMVPLELYYYIQRNDSLTHANSEQLINDVILGRLETHYQCLNLIPKEKPDYRAMCIKDIYKKMLLYRYRAYGTTYQKKACSVCKKIYMATIKEYIKIPMSGVEKVKILVFHHCPLIYRMVISAGELMVKFKLIKTE